MGKSDEVGAKDGEEGDGAEDGDGGLLSLHRGLG